MAEQADGIAACKELLAKLQTGKQKQIFLKVWGVRGGCVGGPKAILEKGEGRKRVEQYGSRSGISDAAGKSICDEANGTAGISNGR